MKMYLIHGEIEVRRYMASQTDRTTEFRIVMADNEDMASEKWHSYWSGMTEKYSVYYHTHVLDITESL